MYENSEVSTPGLAHTFSCPMRDLNDLEGVFFMKFAYCDETFPSPSLRTCINASSPPVHFTSKISDREEGIVIYSFCTWFSFLTWVWVNICLEIVSSKTATTRIIQSGVRNWPASVSRHEIEVFNPQAWELAGIWQSETIRRRWIFFRVCSWRSAIQWFCRKKKGKC